MLPVLALQNSEETSEKIRRKILRGYSILLELDESTLNKDAFCMLLEVIRPHMNTSYIPAHIQLGCTLRFLSEGGFQKAWHFNMAHSVHVERSIHEMLKDTPSMNESTSSIHSGTQCAESSRPFKPPNSLPLRNHSAPVTPSSPQNGLDNGIMRTGASKIDTIKNWSISTYKCTRQIMLEKLGKSQRTVDSELEAQIEQLRETQRKYLSILRLTRAFSSHFHHVVVTQHALAEAFADLAQKSPELQEEFTCNSETQRNLTKNGELLLNALNFFISSVNTLCNKTIDDTLLTIRQYETARVEFDAYRMDLENAKPETPQSPVSEEAQKNYTRQKDLYEKLRADVAVKMQFLDENRIKVMHKQLVLLHNAIAAYFSGNAAALESTLKQFNIKHQMLEQGPGWNSSIAELEEILRKSPSID